MSKRIISGIKPTGKLTLGNYLGAMRHWAPLQEQGTAYYFIADLHALNDRPNPEDLRSQTLDMVAWLMACGINPRKSVLFVESQVPAHGQLQTILNNYVTMGELSRMTQFKDKSAKVGAEGQVDGLFQYPVLMASDILLYDIDIVPVGDDQRQHVELARDIANRFNNAHSQTFTVPEAQVVKESARVMNLQDPTRKMSKSDVDNGGAIYLLDSEDEIRTKIKRAVTDSGSTIEAAADRPAMSNLIQIYAAVTDMTIAEVEAMFVGKGYGDFKAALAEVVVDKVMELQSRFSELRSDEVNLARVIEAGAAQARELSEAKLTEVKERVGLI
jgi:tryptophanyl-tRNA synthetase